MNNYPDGTYFLYVICRKIDGMHIGPIKIGLTGNLLSRLSAIQNGNPDTLEIFYSFAVPNRSIADSVEGAFKSVLERHCRRGEWFDLEPKHAKIFLYMALNVSLAILGKFSTLERREFVEYSGAGL